MLASLAPSKPRLAFIETCFVDELFLREPGYLPPNWDGSGWENYAPDGSEVRAMMCDGILHGAHGLFFWNLRVGIDDGWAAMTGYHAPGVMEEIGVQNALITSLASVLQTDIDPPEIGVHRPPPTDGSPVPVEVPASPPLGTAAARYRFPPPLCRGAA